MSSTPAITFLVQAPNKLTTFKCGPKWIMNFNSDARDSRAVGSRDDFAIFTATVLQVWSFRSRTVPRALASTTTPNCPTPSCFPVH